MHGEDDDTSGVGQGAWDSKTVLQPGGPKPFDVAEELGDAAAGAAAAAGERLALGDEERLPWLEGADDVDEDDDAGGNGRLIGFALVGLLVLAALIGGIWYASNRGSTTGNADGSLIEASKEPYKVAPSDPGGKTFAGTGDSSFKVSEGEKPAANLAGSASPTPAPKPGVSASGAAANPAGSGATASGGARPAASASSAPASAGAAGGVGVQVGAFSSSALAEAGWQKLVGNHEALKGLSHRVIEGKADIGTVYRLQAVAGDAASADALCRKLQAGGLKCQVKR